MSNYNGFIYETINLVTGHRYIGRHGRSGNPNDPDDSWYLGSGVIINNAIEKYGVSNFRRIIIDPGPLSLEEAIKQEEYYLNLYDCANNSLYYNLTNTSHEGYPVLKGEAHPRYGKPSAMRGKHHTEETKTHLSKVLTGKKRTAEQIEHIRESQLGKTLSDEHKQRLRIALTGNKNSLGHKHTEDSKLKISKSLSGELNPMYGRRGEDNPNYGSHLTDDAKQKIGENTIGRIWINNGVSNKRIYPTELDSYLIEGYVRGQLKRLQKLT